MVRLKRCLCLVLALALLLTWPGFLPQKAEAVAVADDAAVLSLALLFTTWAGVTFAQSDQAVTAMKSFLSTKTASAASLAGLITKNLVVEGTKLLITGDVRSAFGAVLPEIQDFFQVKSDTVASSGSGALTGSYVVGCSYLVPVYPRPSSSDEVVEQFFEMPHIYPGELEHFLLSYGSRELDCYIYPVGSYYYMSYKNPDSGQMYLISSMGPNLQFFSFAMHPGDTYLSIMYNSDSFRCSSTAFSLGSTYDVFITPLSGSIDFKQSSSVTGSSVSSALDAADLDTADASISIAPVTSVVNSGVAGSTAAPGLSAEDYERILADALAGTAVLPTTPDPTTAEPTETTPEEDKETMVSPDVFNKGLTGVKESLADGFSSVVARLDWAIHYLTDWLSTFWAAVVKAVTVTIPDFLSGIADALTTFFTVTFPAWVTDVKDWAVALPKTISDAIAVALAAVFVPSEGYLDARIESLRLKFGLFDSILNTVTDLSNFFDTLGAKPPVILIDLSSASDFWNIGGRVIFIDLTWYSKYKPSMDFVLSAFLWIWFLWRILLSLPGIIQGTSGFWGQGSVVPEAWQKTLPAGKDGFFEEKGLTNASDYYK